MERTERAQMKERIESSIYEFLKGKAGGEGLDGKALEQFESVMRRSNLIPAGAQNIAWGFVEIYQDCLKPRNERAFITR